MKITVLRFLLLLPLVVLSCGCAPKPFDLEKLIVDGFDPQTGEKVLILVDLPRAGLPDNKA